MTGELGMRRALQVLEAAEERAVELGVSMSFAIVDAWGHLKALHRMDGADWISPQIAIGKAYTAAAFQTSSEEVAQRAEGLPMFVTAITAMTSGRFIAQKGGLPIEVDGQVLGAIGASGAGGHLDVDILEFALAKALPEQG